MWKQEKDKQIWMVFQSNLFHMNATLEPCNIVECFYTKCVPVCIFEFTGTDVGNVFFCRF